MDPNEKAAKDIKELQERIYVPRHEYRVVEARSFPHLDLSFYDKVRDSLIAQGCIWLGDVEIVSLKGIAFDFRTFIRSIVSADGTTSVGLYHPKPIFLLRAVLWILRAKIGKSIDCETEFSNGEYLVTSNCMEANKITAPPGFHNERFPLGTPYLEIFQIHLRRLQEYLQSHPGVYATRMRTLEELLDMQHRMHEAKAAHRKNVGYVTEAELRNMGAKPNDAAEIKRAMDRSDTAK